MKKQVGVSIPRWLYERMRDYFHVNKQELALWGVNSVNGLISTWLQQNIDAAMGRYEVVREAMRQNTLVLSDDVEDRLRAFLSKRYKGKGRRMSEIIEEALIEYLDLHESEVE